MTFAYFPGEDPEQTAAYLASLEVALTGARDRGESDSAKQMEAELRRVRGEGEKQTRPRGPRKQTR